MTPTLVRFLLRAVKFYYDYHNKRAMYDEAHEAFLALRLLEHDFQPRPRPL